MGKKKVMLEEEQVQEGQETVQYEVRNLTQNILAVQYFNEEGKPAYLHLRIQGRGGQTPPVIPATAVTDQMKELEKNRLIKLVKI